MDPQSGSPPSHPGAVRRLVHKADFERLLGSRGGWRSAHFAVHHVAAPPEAPRRGQPEAPSTGLSTVVASATAQAVDKSIQAHWLGLVVPKRHARRSVTRSLIKRHMRAALSRHAAQLPSGQWLVRLRQPFPVQNYPSAASEALSRAVRTELDALLQRIARSAWPGAAP